MRIEWLSDEAAKELGLNTEKEKQAFLRQQKFLGDRECAGWFAQKLAIAEGKDTSGIPDGDYCYTSWIPEEYRAEWEALVKAHGELSGEAFGLYCKVIQSTNCPYFECTDYGTVKCYFLEEESFGVSEGSYEWAVAHFGSEEAAEEACQGSIVLGDAMRCCKGVLSELKSDGSGQ